MPATRYVCSGGGTQTAGLCIGGYPGLTTTFHYNGSTWTEGGTLNAGKDYSSASGTQTDSLCWGNEPASALSEAYDGTSWVTSASLNTARYQAGSFHTGQGPAAVTFGNSPSHVTTVEEFSAETTAAEAADIDFD